MSLFANSCEALIQAVIERLLMRFPDLAVEAYPEMPEQYQLLHPVGALLVRYAGSRYGAPSDTHLLLQERRLVLEVTLVMRALQGASGVVQTLDLVRLALAGFIPPAFDRVMPVGDEFLGEQDGIWRHAIDFVTSTSVLGEEDAEVSPLATRLTFLERTE